MINFFEREIEKILIPIIENFSMNKIKEISVSTEYEIPYNKNLQIKLLREEDTMSKIHFEASFEDKDPVTGDIFININSYEMSELYHIRFIYRDIAKNPVCLYHIFDLYHTGTDCQEFNVSGEEANVSQYEFIHYDKPIGKIFTDSALLYLLQNISVELIRRYYTDKQRNKI